MKKMNFQRGFWTMAVALLLLAGAVSCGKVSKNRVSRNWSVEVPHEFPNTNWAFEEEVLDFDFEIKDTTQRYEVSVTLLYDTAVATLKDIPLALTLSTPDGMKSFANSHFRLDRQENSKIRLAGSGSFAEDEVVVYPDRKFKVPGNYTLTVYRRAEKADNYGFISLTAKVKVVK